MHFLVAVLFGGLVSVKLIRETSLLLVLGAAPLYATVGIVFLANWGVTPVMSCVVMAGLSLVLWFVKSERPRWVPLTRGQGVLLAVLSMVVLLYTNFYNLNILDSDRYLHDAQIVAFSRGIYPPVNPFFPHLAMNGHFGRDLLMAVLSVPGADPVVVTWWVTPIIQLATFLTLFAATHRLSGSAVRGFTVAAMVFFGVNVGFRVGLIDTFDGSNALAHPWLILLVYLMVTTLERPSWTAWVTAGIVLGTYQLVYMTSFALLLLSGLILFVIKARTKTAWAGLFVTGLLALTLAFTGGGAFTDLAQRGLEPELSKSVQNQGLRVSVTFPKEHLFCVMALTADYQRTSVAYKTSLFSSLYSPPVKSGYVNIFDPDFLTTHWLPLLLAPFSLWFCRRSNLALGFWIFGASSYLVPGLVDFGPIFEYEYFRWQFTAGIGFAAALGYVIGGALESLPVTVERGEKLRLTAHPGTLRYGAALLVLISCLAAGEKLLNDAIIKAQKRDSRWFLSAREYRLSEPVFDLFEEDLKAAAWLRERTEPGSRLLTNRLKMSPEGMWPDTTIATLAGAFPAGHAYPPKSQVTPHGNPAFLPDALYTAFWTTGDFDLLFGSGVSWVMADTRSLDETVIARLTQVEHLWFGDRLVAEVPTPEEIPPGARVSVSAVEVPSEELRLGTHYWLPLEVSCEQGPAVVELSLDDPVSVPLRFVAQPGDNTELWSLVTPHDEGSYRALLSDAEGRELASFPIVVDFLERLSLLRFEFEFPQMRARQLYTLRGTVHGPSIRSEDELDYYYRFRRSDGDYAWEVDEILRPLQLDLPARPEIELEVMTPVLEGPYEFEIWFYDRHSGRRIKAANSVSVSIEHGLSP